MADDNTKTSDTAQRWRRRFRIETKFPEAVPYMTPEQTREFANNAKDLDLARKYLRLDDAAHYFALGTAGTCVWSVINLTIIGGEACVRRWKDKGKAQEQLPVIKEEMERRKLPNSVKGVGDYIKKEEIQEQEELRQERIKKWKELEEKQKTLPNKKKSEFQTFDNPSA